MITRTNMKNFTLSLLLVLFAGCTATGPAEDKWDREENEDKIAVKGVGKIFGKNDEVEAENEELKNRIERLEKAQGIPPENKTTAPSGDITAPPAITSQATQQSEINPGDTVSYQEWLRARQQNNDEYKEFQEYKEWLEFKKQKEQQDN